MEEWRRLVTPGHVWVARLNAATWVGALVAFLFAVSLVWTIYGNTVGLAKALSHVNDAPVTFKGVNHHDTHPEKGRAVNSEDQRIDLALRLHRPPRHRPHRRSTSRRP